MSRWLATEEEVSGHRESLKSRQIGNLMPSGAWGKRHNPSIACSGSLFNHLCYSWYV